MTGLRTVLELARADFLERARRFGFLLTLGGAAALAYTVHADVWTVLVRTYAPSPGPAATGTLVAVVTSTFLSLAAFYVVRGSVERDLRTGVGSILAATPASRLQYAVGKFLSNATVLGAMLLLLAGLAVAISVERGGGMSFHGARAVISPLLLVTGPTLVAVAGVAVLFDALPWIRGTAGNVAYFFLWTGVLTLGGLDTGGSFTDLTGLALVFETMQEAIRAAHPGVSAEGITITVTRITEDEVTRFAWSGIGWSLDHVARRLYWVGVGAVLSGMGALALRLFDPFRDRGSLFASSPGTEGGRAEAVEMDPGASPQGERQPESVPVSDLPSPERAGAVVSFLRSVRGELRLLISGHPWWWYVALLGANVAALVVPSDAAGIPLLVAWLLPLSAWSALGCRERLHGTESLLFAGPSPRLRQLPAQLAAGVSLSVVAAAAPLARMAAGGHHGALLAAAAGALFVPTLALCLGTWTGTERTFQAVYLLLWYVGPLNEVPALDFMGVTGRATAAGATAAFLAAAAGLGVLAWLGRGRRLRAAG